MDKKLLFIFFLPCLFLWNTALATSDAANLNLQITGFCGDGFCQEGLGETTENCQSDCLVAGQHGGGLIYFQIKNIIASDTTTNSAKITWLTTKFSVCNFYWGFTPDYEKEIISETKLTTGHLIYLTNLLPGTYYHFKISCQTESLEKDHTTDQQFKTLLTLNNVNNFSAKSQDKGIALTWQNPVDEKFFGVKILRSERFFPFNLQSGIIIYEGYGDSFLDIDVVSGKTYYYTIFTYDKEKNYSSGAIAYALFGKGAVVPPEPTPPPETQIVKEITINDFKFFSQEQNIKIEDYRTIKVESEKHLTISIDADKIPDKVEAITVTINQDGKEYSYLLKFDKESNVYEVSFTTPGKSGNYSIKINFLDYKNKTIKQINGILNVFKISKKFDWRPIVIIWLEILLLVIFVYWVIINNKTRLKPKKIK